MNIDILQIVQWIFTVIGVASLLVQAFANIAKITPNTKDDAFAGRLKTWVGWFVAASDKIALNLPASKAKKKV